MDKKKMDYIDWFFVCLNVLVINCIYVCMYLCWLF